MSFLQGWKTVAFNAVMALIAAVKIFAPDSELPTPESVTDMLDISDKALLAITAVGNVILRAVTSTPIFQKKV